MSSRFHLRWPVDSRTITQRFGMNPQIYAKFNLPGHEGVDFRAPEGANVYACVDGHVFEIRPNNGNAYGLNVRVRHIVDGQEYRTVYAHLSRSLVTLGQSVRAGERIALAGNTGHSFGAHLHLTLKLIGAKTPGYPDGIIDPFPYLQETETPEPTELTVYVSKRVRLRAQTAPLSSQLAWLEPGEALSVLEEAIAARDKVGRFGSWLHVQREDGLAGYVAAWYVQLEPSPGVSSPPCDAQPSDVIVYAVEPLYVRREPTGRSSRIAIVLPHEPLCAIGDPSETGVWVGDRGLWLHVIIPSDDRGYVAAWQMQRQPGLQPRALFTVYPAEDTYLRVRPALDEDVIGQVSPAKPLDVFDDPDRAQTLVGRYDEWLYVETPDGQRGWIPAWYVSVSPA